MQAFGGQRGVQGLGDALGGGRRIEGRRAVAEVEGEGVGCEAGVGPDNYRALVAARGSGLFQHRLQPLGQFGIGGDHQARGGLDLAGEGFKGGADGSFREAVEGGRGDGAGAGERQLRRTDPMGVGDLCQSGQGLTARGDDRGERVGLTRGDAGQGHALALGPGGLADHLDFVGGVGPLRPRRGEGDIARVVEDGVEAEFGMRF